jgi:aspartyl-tRNA(Asn)/glutamyl-tRNA(Gln) amidotransferase subunit C
MTPVSSVVTPDVVRKVADLARLRVAEDEIGRWADQLSRIVSYIDQLSAIPEDAFAEAGPAGATPLRADEPRPGRGDEALAENAPRRLHGYGVVPRVVGSGS